MKISRLDYLTGLFLLVLAAGPAWAQQSEEDSIQGNDPDVQTIEGVLEQNIPEGAPKIDLPVRPQKTPGTIDFSQLKDNRSYQDTVVIQKT